LCSPNIGFFLPRPSVLCSFDFGFLLTVRFMLPDPFGECFFPKKSVRMLGKTAACPLRFNAWVVYSYLWWKCRYKEGVTAKKIAAFTGLQRSSTVKRALAQLQQLRLAVKQGGRWVRHEA
jgi:hypothetical protein